MFELTLADIIRHIDLFTYNFCSYHWKENSYILDRLVKQLI